MPFKFASFSHIILCHRVTLRSSERMMNGAVAAVQFTPAVSGALIQRKICVKVKSAFPSSNCYY